MLYCLAITDNNRISGAICKQLHYGSQQVAIVAVNNHKLVYKSCVYAMLQYISNQQMLKLFMGLNCWSEY